MAREILFKAKRFDNEWVEGYLYIGNDGVYEISRYDKELGIERYTNYVRADTLCQFTGLLDKNGNKIWENDVVKVESGVIGSPFMHGMIGKIIYTECAFFIEPKDKAESRLLFDECAEYEVVGNIFDNPELLGGGE